MKKLEIIIESVERRRVCRILDEVGVKGYSIIDDIQGRGKTGPKSAQDLSNILKSSLIIVVDEEPIITKAIEQLKDVFKFYSGKIFLSEVTVIE
uniref:Nitrogen regulatory protein PII n=1 Tax=Ignavibacterium album TaxID=591197 RepID=A0A7V3E6I4_9BACT